MKIFILTLGCAKNQSDSEDLAGMLEMSGFTVAQDVNDADVAIVNTCGFIKPAVEECIEAILDLESIKTEGQLDKIIVAGCLVNRYGEDLKREFPVVDLWLCSQEWQKLIKVLSGREGPTEPSGKVKKGFLPVTNRWSRFLKISEGCNKNCSFCTIPSIRGPLRSLPLSSVMAIAEELVESGARELCIVSQDPTMYGVDIAGIPLFMDLLIKLEKNLPDDMWIRLNYLNPSGLNVELLEYIASAKNILSYLDVPVQHVAPEILRRMNRPDKYEEIRNLFLKAREIDPLFALRTTFIVGFPGEKSGHFEKVLDFVEEIKFDRLGAFPFYPEEGTPAAEMDQKIDDITKGNRYRMLMNRQAEISLERQRLFEGQKIEVLVEDLSSDNDLIWGRSYRDAPEVDGMVGIQRTKETLVLTPGQMIQVRITDAAEYDLFGEVVTNDIA